MIYSTFMIFPPQSRSQARTYQNDTPKKTSTNTINTKSAIIITSDLELKKNQEETPGL